MPRYTIAEARERALKPRDSWWTILVVDPVALPMAVAIANRTRITPNQLTGISLLTGIGAAWLFLLGTRGALVAGALAYYVSFLFDCLDGKVARLKETRSAVGAWLDYGLDRVRVVVAALALMGGQVRRTDRGIYWVLAALVIGLDLVRYANALRSTRLTRGIPATPAAMEGVRARLARHRIRPHLFSGIEFQMVVFIIGPITGQIIGITIAGAVLLVIFEVAAFARLRAVVRAGGEL